jgi:hypothetical protein
MHSLVKLRSAKKQERKKANVERGGPFNEQAEHGSRVEAKRDAFDERRAESRGQRLEAGVAEAVANQGIHQNLPIGF